MSASIKVKIDGVYYDVNVMDDGEFRFDHEGVTIKGPTFAGVASRARDMMKNRVQMAIPATILENQGYRNNYKDEPKTITVLGIHSGNGNVMFRYPGDTKSRQTYSRGNSLYSRFSPEEEKEYVRLREAKEKATEDLSNWLMKRALPTGDGRELLKYWKQYKKQHPTEQTEAPVKKAKTKTRK